MAKLTEPREPLDSLDAEEVAATAESRGWQIITERVESMIEGYRSQLETEERVNETTKIRGAIAALRTVLRLPTILQGEVTKEGA
jgi:hypothetical protein